MPYHALCRHGSNVERASLLERFAHPQENDNTRGEGEGGDARDSPGYPEQVREQSRQQRAYRVAEVAPEPIDANRRSAPRR